MRRRVLDYAAVTGRCGDNVKKISETRFEMRKTGFTPDGNLAILILTKLKPQQENGASAHPKRLQY